MVNFDKLMAISPFVSSDTDDNPPAWATSWTNTGNTQTPDSVPAAWYNNQTGDFNLPEVQVSADPEGWGKVTQILTGDKPKKRNYIGGTPTEARETFWNQEPELRQAVDSIAGRYNISSSLLKNRLNHEGFVDSSIRRINGTDDYYKPQHGNELLKSDKYNGFNDFGLDDVGSMILDGKVKLINENWYSDVADNERDRPVTYADGETVLDNIGIMAATLSYFKQDAKKSHPKFTDHQAEVYANMMYNRGKEGARKYYEKNGLGKYDFNSHALGGPLVDAARNYYKEGGPKGSQLWSNNNFRLTLTPNEQGVYKVPYYEDTPGFKEHDYDEIVPDDILSDYFKGKGYTYGDMYAVWNKQVRDDLDRQGYNTGELTTEERRRAMGLKPNAGFSNISGHMMRYRDPAEYDPVNAGRIRMGEKYENVRKYGSQYSIFNWRDSPEYAVQNARYQAMLREKGLPIHDYGDVSLTTGQPVRLYSTQIDYPIKDKYGKIWMPAGKYKDENSSSYQHTEYEDMNGLATALAAIPAGWLTLLGYPEAAKAKEVPIIVSQPENDRGNSLSETLIHEFNHTGKPKKEAEGLDPEFLNVLHEWFYTKPFYFEDYNNTELAARTAQVLNHQGISSPDSVRNMTSDDFGTALSRYMQGIVQNPDGSFSNKSSMDNNMQEYRDLFAHSDRDAFWNWAKNNTDNIEFK